MGKDRQLSELLKYRYAHRGLHEKPVIAENSMTAFERAVIRGYGIELDVHLTADNRLAVIHDASLLRTCGKDVMINEITMTKAKSCHLEESRDGIPELREVLDMVAGRIPLIIELKTDGANRESLCRRTLRELEKYDGPFCVESFDPMAVRWFKKNRPHIVRGQLAGRIKDEGGKMNPLCDYMLRHLWVNLVSDPDFVAYRFEDRECKALKKYDGPRFFWTIKKYEDLRTAEALGAAAIFERFDPADQS